MVRLFATRIWNSPRCSGRCFRAASRSGVRSDAGGCHSHVRRWSAGPRTCSRPVCCRLRSAPAQPRSPAAQALQRRNHAQPDRCACWSSARRPTSSGRNNSSTDIFSGSATRAVTPSIEDLCGFHSGRDRTGWSAILNFRGGRAAVRCASDCACS